MSLSPITIAPVFSWWLISLLFGMGLGSAMYVYWLIRGRLGRKKALAISFFRLLSIFLLISLALNPSLDVQKELKTSPILRILVDTSQSMGLPGQAGQGSRLDEARRLLLAGSKPLLKSFAERLEVRLYAFGESLGDISPEKLSSLQAAGGKGDLSEALAKLTGKNSLVVLISDGKVKWDGNSSTGLPIITIPVGDEERYKDILIKSVKAPAMAFRGREVTIDVTVKGYGYAGQTLPVVLKEGERLLTVRSVRLEGSPGEGTISLSFTPEEVGQYKLSVSIPLQFGESLASNNTVNLSLKVVRDKIRILMVSGTPSMNYRFMRMAFKNDPSIDLLSFVILRTPSNILNVPLQEQSLIPLPVETLFNKELKNFDLVVFDNFLHRLYFRPDYLESIREFVREGGGLATIGGPNFLGEGGYVGTAIEEILPVRWAGKDGYRQVSSLPVRLSRAGIAHPITRLSPDESDNFRLWREMPPLEGFNLLELKRTGTVLLEGSDGTSRPILTVGTYGKGRVLVLATDDSWKWNMGMVAKRKGNWAYLRFMEKVVRWLTRDPSLESVQIILPETAGAAGQETEFRIRVKESSSSKSRGAVSLSVLSPDGGKIGSRLKPTGQPGDYLGAFLPEKGGIYKVKVETGSRSFEESIPIVGSGEDLDGAPELEQLRKISSATGGKLLAGSDDLLTEISALAEKGQGRFLEERRLALWDNPYVLTLIVALLSAEWFFRRRWGLI